MRRTIGLDRRGMLAGIGAAVFASALGAAGPLREATVARVVVDNDFAGDPDALVALAHQLLAPGARVTLVTTTAVDPTLSRLAHEGVEDSAARGRLAALALFERMGLAATPPVASGSERLGDFDPSAAARAIVAEAMRADALPLFIACGGPLTNVAAALRLEPRIAARATLVWIGGGAYPAGGPEYNMKTDLAAARAVIEGTSMPLWQVPDGAYRQLRMSVAEWTEQVRPLSALTAWLDARYAALPPFVTLSGTLTLGDSALPLLTALAADSSEWSHRPAHRVKDDGGYGTVVPGRSIRVYERLDARLVMADFTARLRAHAADGPARENSK